MAKIDFEIVGIRPLVMHNGMLADPDSEGAIALKTLTSKKGKSQADRAEISRVEWMGCLYFDSELGPVIPEPNILACLVEGGKFDRKGKDIDALVSVTEPRIKLEYDGPRNPEKMWAAGMYDRRVVSSSGRPGGPKVVRVRPMFQPGWSLRFSVFVDDELDTNDVIEAMKTAGKRVGLCERRKFRWGRFEVKKAKVTKTSD